MGAKTIGFALADEDRERLDELVEYFGNGNRSAYLRETLKVMTSVKLAEEWQRLQAYGQSRLDALGLTIDDVPGLVRRELKGRE
jgi:predicted DNA-binding protein